MDHKLRQILELALRPDTGEHESQAALSAARRLVAKHGMDQMLDKSAAHTTSTTQTVYVKFTCTHIWNATITVPPKYMHSFIERLFQDARILGVDVEVIKCKTVDGRFDRGMILDIRVLGTHDNLSKMGRALESYVKDMQKDTSTRAAPPPYKKSFWARLFGS